MTDQPRPAVRWANYPGDCRGSLGFVYGPNTTNEPLTSVEETYDPETDTTRIGFAFGLTPTTDVRRTEVDTQIAAYSRIRALFGGRK